MICFVFVLISYYDEAERPFFFLERTDSESEIVSTLRDNVALLPQQTQQQVLGVLGPPVDSGAPQPVWDMFLLHSHKIR